MLMEIILTHEQADFDALGSMLGAYLLNENALPVIPRRLNRNVRTFINLYGADLPFVDPRDTSISEISSITLVDTQSLITLKGMTAKTKVHVIDHHQKRPDMKKAWTYNIERSGACTTLLVEELREHISTLNVIHATLMLLAIYEDTGSMTYVGTTPRDLWAATFLLEQGASLRIASKYLNPPLSPEQRNLYDRLLDAAKLHTIQGKKIFIACGEAPDMTEEVSSIAHKLRDMLDLDVLFLLVSTGEGIRMVARSTTDQVDVSKIAGHFGGGGHERAAAALIHFNEFINSTLITSLDDAYNELVRILPQYVHPAITVGQIMSSKPLLLSPDTSVKEAAQLMQRFGYEGYPVIEKGKVIGLLNRRAIDRAVGHKLNLNASSLMEAGDISVTPEDTLEHLQHVMARSGWGQLPVINPDSQEVIGIVTRTDLLETISRSDRPSPDHWVGPGIRQNLADKLVSILPPARLALLEAIAAQASEQRHGIYIVGGFVRDLLLEQPSIDFDFVVEGDAIALARALAARYGGRVVSHNRFGTAKWWIADTHHSLSHLLPLPAPLRVEELPQSIDFISARTEFYEYPTALPTIKTSSIKLDLHRRDFTINTMALRLDGRRFGDLYDYWGGFNDLSEGLVHVLHSLSFVDDPTRLLRAVRFEQRFNFKIEKRTLQLMEEARPLLHQVSGERLRHEIDLIFLEKNPTAMLARLEELQLLTYIHPDLKWRDNLSDALQYVLCEPINELWGLPESIGNASLKVALAYLVWLSDFPPRDAGDIMTRLRLPVKLQHSLQAITKLCQDMPGMLNAPISDAVTQLDSVPLVSLYILDVLAITRCHEAAQQAHTFLQKYISDLRHVKPFTTGQTLRDQKLRPGPIYREILQKLRAAWLDKKITSSEEEQELLQQLLEESE
jgi:tRNA nucleotidyltransferase (CCA-adding enzyme)